MDVPWPVGEFVTIALGGIAVRANVSLSFSPPKLCYMMAENEKFTGEWVLLDIGLDDGYILQASTPYFFTLKEDVLPLSLSRARFAHKGHFGHAFGRRFEGMAGRRFFLP